jgi:DNA-binding HxlR family transcriptional regulator
MPLIPKYHGPECAAIRSVLDRVGDKWSVLIVALLGEGKKRFSELGRTLEDVSKRMLTLTLKRLERDGLIARTAYPTVPPRVEYELTKLGRTFLVPVRQLTGWALRNRERIERTRQSYDEQKPKNLLGFQ